MTTGEAIAAVFETYAAEHGKERWGDKTPLYMQYLPLLERLFPDARFVHLVRDGRDAALSFLSVPRGDHDRGLGPSARRRRLRLPVGDRGARRARARRARRCGAVPRAPLRGPRRRPGGGAPSESARSRGLEYDEAMLGYVGQTDSARKEHQQRLNEPPRVGVRDWRTEMAAGRRRRLRGGRGRPPRTSSATRSTTRGHDGRRLAAYRAKTAAWRGVGAVMQRSPLWRRRHPPLEQTSS